MLLMLTALPAIAALLAAMGLRIAHARLENQHQAYLRAWESELRAAEAKRPEPDGRDHQQYMEAALAVEGESTRLYAERAFAADIYLADQSLLLERSLYCLTIAAVCFAAYGSMLRCCIGGGVRAAPGTSSESAVS
jgi:hypothetical protein